MRGSLGWQAIVGRSQRSCEWRLTDDQAADLSEIVCLLDEAYRHYFDNSDGHCKSSEGAIDLHFGTFFDRNNGEDKIGCSIYSYVLGPHRNHSFESIESALAEVKKWHKAETEHDYGLTNPGRTQQPWDWS